MMKKFKSMPIGKKIAMGIVVFPWFTLMAGASLLVNLFDKILHCFGGCLGM